MRCDHLHVWLSPVSGAKVMVCKKGRSGYYTPTFLHIRDYCTGEDHESCVFLNGSARRPKRSRKIYCTGVTAENRGGI